MQIQDPVRTTGGLVAGTIIGNSARRAGIYRGIPYAGSKAGDNRWKPPSPPTEWRRRSRVYGNYVECAPDDRKAPDRSTFRKAKMPET